MKRRNKMKDTVPRVYVHTCVWMHACICVHYVQVSGHVYMQLCVCVCVCVSVCVCVWCVWGVVVCGLGVCGWRCVCVMMESMLKQMFCKAAGDSLKRSKVCVK